MTAPKQDKDANGEQPLASEMIAEHTADKYECAQEQRIGFDDPLQRGDIGVEAQLDGRQRDINRSGVDNSQAGAADRRRQNAGVGEAAMRRRSVLGRKRRGQFSGR